MRLKRAVVCSCLLPRVPCSKTWPQKEENVRLGLMLLKFAIRSKPVRRRLLPARNEINVQEFHRSKVHTIRHKLLHKYTNIYFGGINSPFPSSVPRSKFLTVAQRTYSWWASGSAR